MIRVFGVDMSPHAPHAVAEVLQSGYVGEGAVVKRFEAECARLASVQDRASVFLSTINCSAAIQMAAEELHQCGRRQHAITTPMTCTATNIALMRAGYRLVWADVDPNTGLIRLDSVTAAMKSLRLNGDNAIICAVDWGGNCADVGELARWAPVIRDSAHCWLGGRQWETSGGDGTWPIITTFSFGPIKHLTCGGNGGGMIVPEVRGMPKRIRLARWYGLDRETSSSFRCDQDISILGAKNHLTDDQAAVGLANIPWHSDAVGIRATQANRYLSLINETPSLSLNRRFETPSWWIFEVLVDPSRRDALAEYMASHGVETSRVHARNDKHTIFARDAMATVPLDGVSTFDDSHLAIPIGPWVTREDQSHIIELLNAWSAN